MRKYNTADRLRELMTERGWKQVDVINNSKPFQEKLGVKLGKSALSQYVNGVQSPDQKKLALLALTFNVSEAWLMGYDVPRGREVNSEPDLSGLDLRELAKTAKTFDGKPLNEEDIEAIENRIAEIEVEMNENGSDFGKLSALQKELDQENERLLEKYDRYDYLSELDE